MSLKKLLNRAKNRIGDTAEDTVSLVNRARTYLEQQAPAAAEGLESLGSAGWDAARRTGLSLPIEPLLAANNLRQGRAPDLPMLAGLNDLTRARSLADAGSAVKQAVVPDMLKDTTRAGNLLAGEPLAFGANRLTGMDGGSPYSGRNLADLAERGIGGKAAALGIQTATDPLTYVPTGKLPTLAQVGLGALGVGDMGGRGVAGKFARNAVAGAGMGAGQELAAEHSDNPLVQMGGGVLGMAAGLGLAGRTPGLKNLMATEPRPRARNLEEATMPTDALAEMQARQKNNPLVKVPVPDEAVRAANQRIAEQPEGPLASLHMGPQLLKREVGGALIGGGIGYATADDENKLEQAVSGAAAGVLGTAAVTRPAGRDILRKLAGNSRGQMTARAAGTGIGAATGFMQGDTLEDRLKKAGIGAAEGYGIVTGAQMGKRAAKALLQPGTTDDILKFHKDSTSHAGAQAWAARDKALSPFAVLQDEIAKGGVTETPTRAAQTNAIIAGAVSPEAAARADAARLAPAVIREDPTGYVLSPRAQAAMAQIDNLYLNQEAGDVAYGVLDPTALQSNYQNRVWKQAPPSPIAPISRQPGATQAFQRARTIDNFLEGMAQGYEPQSLDIPDLLAHRVQAGYTARAQFDLLNAVKPTVVTKPAAGYTHVDYGFLKRLFPTFDNAALDSTLADLEAGVITRGQAKTAVRDAAGAGRMNLYVPDAVAENLKRYFDAESAGFKKWGEVIQVPREAALGFDVAMVGRLLPTQLVQTSTGANPGRAGVAAAKAIRDSFDMKRIYRDPRFRDFWSRHLENVAPGDKGDVLALPTEKTPLQRVPLIGPAGRALEDWQFGSFVPALKFHTAEALYRSMSNRGKYKAMLNSGAMTPDDLGELIGRRVDTVFSGISRARAGTTRNQETMLRTAFLSPTWFRGVANNVADVTKPGVEGDLARRFWFGMATLGVSTSVGVTLALQWKDTGERPSYNDLVTLIDPTEPNSITNPLSKNFLKVGLPDGGNFDLWGPITPVTRSILRPLARGVKDGQEAGAQKEWYQAVADGIGSAFGWENTESLRDWVESRQSIPISVALDLKENKDFRDRVITNAEGNERLRDQAGYLAAGFLPGIAEAVLSTEKTALPEPGFSPRTAVRGLAQAAGFNHNAGPFTEPAIKSAVSSFLTEQGINPGVDPVATFKSARDKIPVDAYQRFRADNPQVLTYIDGQAAEKAANRERPVGRAAVEQYNFNQDRAAQARNAAIAAAGVAHRQTGDGDTYRKAVQAAWASYNGAMEQAADVIFDTRDRDQVNAYIDKVYGKSPDSPQMVNRAFDEYESIRAEDDTPEARDAMLEARRAYLQPGGTADRKYGAGTSTRLKSALRDRYREIGGETYARYFDAQQVMGDYAALPSYLHTDAAAGRRAQAIVNRAQDARRLGSPLPMLVLILNDPKATEEDRINALLINKSGSKLRNPAKKQFYQANARTIGEFYSSVGYELLDQIAGAA